jgi:hypothetical protein
VALDADPNTGFAVVHGQSIFPVGGTSLAAPMFAGFLAGMLSEADRSTGLGDIHGALYAAPDSDFQDVVAGSNGGFATGAGFDNVSGLGAPRFGALAAALGVPAVARATYHPIDPVRIADTRTGVGAPLARLGPGQSLTVAVAGSTPDVPADGVTAAVVNVTAINPSQSTYLSVYPTGAVGGNATSAVNVAPGTPTPNLVTVKTDAAGNISVYNRFGTVDVAVDLEGFYARDGADTYTALAPARIMDTRFGTGAAAGKVGPAGTVTLHVEGVAGLPSGGVDAVTLNVTAVNASTSTWVSVYPTGFISSAGPSNLNVPAVKAVANLVTSKVSPGGDVTFFNAFGSTHLVADIEGYYSSGSGLGYTPVPPVRVLDTRTSGSLGAGVSRSFLVAARGSRAGGVALNLTGVQPTAGTFLSLFPANVDPAVGRSSSALNLDAHAIRANMTVTAVAGPEPERETVFNLAGVTDVLADLSGYFSGQPVALPHTSVTASAPGTASVGSAVLFSASAAADGGSVVSYAPVAVVTFVELGVGVLGSGTIGGDGSASFSKSGLAAGTHTVYAVVAAHDGISGSTSAPVTVTLS